MEFIITFSFYLIDSVVETRSGDKSPLLINLLTFFTIHFMNCHVINR
jgi:hypothetical protein